MIVGAAADDDGWAATPSGGSGKGEGIGDFCPQKGCHQGQELLDDYPTSVRSEIRALRDIS